MAVQTRVQSRLLRVFVLQLALISVATVAGVLAASLVAERILVNKALSGEAQHFWDRRIDDPNFPLPDTLNLSAWFEGVPSAAGDVTGEFSGSDTRSSVPPEAVRELAMGQHRVTIDEEEMIVHVSERDNQRLYLVFSNATVSTLAFWFGIVPLALVLLIMYSLAYLAYRLSKRALNPIVSLADMIERFDFTGRDASELDLDASAAAGDAETRVLTEALEHFVERSKASIERERSFTRYASHELRTPVAVIAGSVSQLELLSLDGPSGRAVERIRRTTGHMTALIDSLLMLARERRDLNDAEQIAVLPVVERLVRELQQAEPAHVLDVSIVQRQPLFVAASEAIVSIVIGNLLRNARAHAFDGPVRVVIDDDAVDVIDSGPGLDVEQQQRVFEPFYRAETSNGQAPAAGHGLGLALVKSTADHYGWRLEVHSSPGNGACFRVIFSPRTVDQTTSNR